MNDTAEKLAIALLLLLFTPKVSAHGNCTKPVRGDISQLDSEQLWAIKSNVYAFKIKHAVDFMQVTLIMSSRWMMTWGEKEQKKDGSKSLSTPNAVR